MTIVIARYQENVGWTSELKFPFCVCNKGEQNLPSDLNTLFVNYHDFGREAQSYLQYILKYWSNLDNYLVFCQGNPFDHCPDFLNKVNNFQFDKDYVRLGHQEITEQILTDSDLWKICNELFTSIPLQTFFPSGQQFIVNTELIKFRSYYFYEKILYLMPNCKDFSGVVERLWELIFNKDLIEK